MGRRLIKVAAAVVVLAVVLVALAPTLVNAGLAQGAIRSAIEEQVNGTVKFASLDVGWGGPQRVGELRIVDESGREAVLLDESRVGRGGQAGPAWDPEAGSGELGEPRGLPPDIGQRERACTVERD